MNLTKQELELRRNTLKNCIHTLEKEWDRLDSMGNESVAQGLIQIDLRELEENLKGVELFLERLKEIPRNIALFTNEPHKEYPLEIQIHNYHQEDTLSIKLTRQEASQLKLKLENWLIHNQ